jgi:hypothetical protein
MGLIALLIVLSWCIAALAEKNTSCSDTNSDVV